MPVRADSWEDLSDKTRRTYAATWGGMEAARERYEQGRPMHRRRPRPGTPATLLDDLGPGVQSITLAAVEGGHVAEVTYRPVQHRADGGQLVVTERTAVFYFAADLDAIPGWARGLVETVSP